jgi:FkbM family methyltransferase
MTAIEFKEHVLRLMYADLRAAISDNYAPERFSIDGVDRSSDFYVDKHVFYLDWFISHVDAIYASYERLADQASRDLYVEILRYRLSGHQHVRIKSRVPALAGDVRLFKSVFTGEPSTFELAGMFGRLVHYDNEWQGSRYAVDTIKDALIYPLVYRQYYFERDGVVVRPEPGDFVIDGGACLGDTSIVFSNTVGPLGQVYAFDPVQCHVDVCAHNFAKATHDNITIFPYGVSDRTADLPAVQLDSYSPGFRDQENRMPLRRIDDLVIDKTITRIDFIKLDVEGSEMAALRGALASIHRFRPKLAISIYHEPNDFYRVLDLIDEQRLGYRFFIDHHTIWDEETILYAIASPATL